MSIPVAIPNAIPQVFYDLIGRVIPGFMLLFMLRFSLLRTEFSFGYIDIVPTGTWFGALFNGIGYLIICYVLGWFLRAFSRYKLKSGGSTGKDEPSLHDKYLMIRLENEAAGFRVAKLRAEVRMLEGGRTGMWIVFGFTIILFVFSRLGWIESYSHSPWYWLFKFSIPLSLAIAFQYKLRSAGDWIEQRISGLYRIMFNDKTGGGDS